MAHKVLVVDDDALNRRVACRIFSAEGFDVAEAGDGRAALERAAADAPDVVFLDVQMPDIDGLAVLETLKQQLPGVPVVMLTGSRDVKTAVRATQLGAFDYLTKPIDRDELVATARRSLETRALRLEVQELRRQVSSGPGDALAAQMGTSPEAARVVEQVSRVAASPFTVLILGETGTGKELVAQAIHRSSDRRRRPFVALDCGAIPEQLLESELFGHERGAFTGADRRKVGSFKLAEGGTCFLDEVGNLPLTLQAKLLRALESKEVQAVGADRPTPMAVRFLAATTDDLQRRVENGQFRADLYFRLAQYTIPLPPLRERPADLAYLTQRFVEEASVELRRPVQAVLPEALDRLRAHTWPGNVRELRNVVRQAVLHAEDFAIRAEDIRFSSIGARASQAQGPVEIGDRSLREIASAAAAAAERHAIVETMRGVAGNKSRAAKALKTDYKTLHVKIKQLGIRARDYDGGA
jgi:DNA-binding NtrC family response regulator